MIVSSTLWIAIDVKTASDNHVLLAIHNVDETIIVCVADVPRMVPSMCPDFSGRFRHFVVAGSHQSSPCDDFSGLIGRKNLSFVIHDGQTHRGSWPATTAQTLGMKSISSGVDRMAIQPGEQHGSFGLSITLAEAGTKSFDSLLEFVGGYRRTGKQKYAQAGI